MPRKPEALESENQELRRKLQVVEARAHLLLQIARSSEGRYALETSLAWIALAAMLLANGMAFAWAR